MIANKLLDQESTEELVAELVDAIKTSPARVEELVALLPEQHSLYEGRSTNATVRMRGYILAAFEQTGLPESALPYVLEELESGRDAYLVAGAAKALRGMAVPTSQMIPFLLEAVQNIKYVDDAVSFASYKPHWPLEQHTTALTEIFCTFGWLGAEATSALSALQTLQDADDDFSRKTKEEIGKAIDAIQVAVEESSSNCCSASNVKPLAVIQVEEVDNCCSDTIRLDLPVVSQKMETASCCDSTLTSIPIQLDLRSVSTNVTDVIDIEVEDQEGQRLKYGDYFGTMPTIVTFFYTRCENPNKCSLTVTKLAHLQALIAEEGLAGKLQTAAFTYDPGYDLPSRLKAYGGARRIVFNKHNRFFRTLSSFEELQSLFQLGVNYNGSIVNRHRIELFVLDNKGSISNSFARLQWDPQEVLDCAKALL